MKILDRYVLWQFLKNYLISFMVLVGMYVVLDLVFNFDEMAKQQNRVTMEGTSSIVVLLVNIGRFYFYKSFLFFSQLAGIIPVVATAFTLVRMSRFNEIVTILAAGVKLLRVAMPIIVASVLLNGLLVVDQELVIPQIIPELLRNHDELSGSVAHSFAVRAMQDDQGSLLFAARYTGPTDQHPAMIDQLDVVYRQEETPVAHLQADRAVYDAARGQWGLTGGRIVRQLLANERPTAPQPVEVYKSNVTPQEIELYRSGETVSLLSTARINQLLERPKSYGTVSLYRAKHMRFTQPIVNMILLLLAIACMLAREPVNVKTHAMKMLILIGACMAMYFLCYYLAGVPPQGAKWANLWPALMAWLPVFVFGPVSIVLLDRVKS